MCADFYVITDAELNEYSVTEAHIASSFRSDYIVWSDKDSFTFVQMHSKSDNVIRG